MIRPILKKIGPLILAGVVGASATYGIMWIRNVRTQAYLDLYVASWDTYFTMQTISELRQGNIDKAESILQSKLSARVQTIGMTLEESSQYRADYMNILEGIKEHRLKYPYKSKSERINKQVEKILSFQNNQPQK